jgi:hypothetical protein
MQMYGACDFDFLSFYASWKLFDQDKWLWTLKDSLPTKLASKWVRRRFTSAWK